MGTIKNVPENPIAIFDSGVGGLTVFKSLKSLMPYEKIVYFGDTANVPYGTKSRETIINYTYNDIDFLKYFNPKLIIAACGTVTSCLPDMKLNDYRIIGVIECSCSTAVKTTKNNKIGVMCTEATSLSGAYERYILRLNNLCKVYTQPCPLLASLIEKINLDKSVEKIKDTVEMYIENFVKYDVDTIILGCTHYPIIKNIVQDIVGINVKLIDIGYETAKYIQTYLQNKNLVNMEKSSNQCSFYVSGDIESFSQTAKIFLDFDISQNLKKVNIANYK